MAARTRQNRWNTVGLLLFVGTSISQAKNPTASERISAGLRRAEIQSLCPAGYRLLFGSTEPASHPWANLRIDWNLLTGRALIGMPRDTFEIFESVRNGHSLPQAVPGLGEVLGRENFLLLERYRRMPKLIQGWNLSTRQKHASRLRIPKAITLKKIDEALGDLFSISTAYRRFLLRDLYAKIAGSPDIVLTSVEVSRVEGLGMKSDIELFRSHAREGKLPHHWQKKDSFGRFMLEAVISPFWELFYNVGAIPYRAGQTAFGIPPFLTNFLLRSVRTQVESVQAYDPKPQELPLFRLFSILDESKFVRKWGLEQEIERYRKDHEKYGEEFAKIRSRQRLYHLAAAIAGIAIVGANLHDDEELLFTESDLDKIVPPAPDDQIFGKVQVLYIAGDLPSAAIRTDNSYIVYDDSEWPLDHGRTLQMNPEEFREYLKRKAVAVRVFTLEGLSIDEQVRLSQALVGGMVGTGRIDKAHPVLPLYFNAIAELNGDLEKALGIWVPPVLDHMDSGSVFYLKLRRLLGDSRMGRTQFVAESPRSARQFEFIADALESVWALRNAMFLAPVHAATEHTVVPALKARYE